MRASARASEPASTGADGVTRAKDNEAKVSADFGCRQSLGHTKRPLPIILLIIALETAPHPRGNLGRSPRHGTLGTPRACLLQLLIDTIGASSPD